MIKSQSSETKVGLHLKIGFKAGNEYLKQMHQLAQNLQTALCQRVAFATKEISLFFEMLREYKIRRKVR